MIEVILRIYFFISRPWFWIYERFVYDGNTNEDFRYLGLEDDSQGSKIRYHLIIQDEYYGFERFQELKEYIANTNIKDV